MPLSKKNICTADDYWNQPKDQHAELIDGQLYDMAPPHRIHQKLVSELHYRIKDYIRQNNGSCDVYPAPFAVNLSGDDRTWVEPDLSVICDKSKLSDRGCEGAPDWILEITSPATSRRDYGLKLFKYRSAGVREYWIINPDKEIVNVYDFEKDETTDIYTFHDEIAVSIYPGFTIRIASLLE